MFISAPGTIRWWGKMLQSRRTQTCREGVLETRGWDTESEWITQLLRATTSLVGCLVSLPFEWEGWMYWMTWGLSLGEFWIILHAVSRIFTVNLMFCVVSVSGLLCSLSALSNLVQWNRNPALLFVGSELTMRTAHQRAMHLFLLLTSPVYTGRSMQIKVCLNILFSHLTTFNTLQ